MTVNVHLGSMETPFRSVNFAMEMIADANHLITRLETAAFCPAARTREIVQKELNASASLVASAIAHAHQDLTSILTEPVQTLMNARQLPGPVVSEQFAKTR